MCPSLTLKVVKEMVSLFRLATFWVSALLSVHKMPLIHRKGFHEAFVTAATCLMNLLREEKGTCPMSYYYCNTDKCTQRYYCRVRHEDWTDKSSVRRLKQRIDARHRSRLRLGEETGCVCVVGRGSMNKLVYGTISCFHHSSITYIHFNA